VKSADLTIIIPTRNRQEHLRRLLSRISDEIDLSRCRQSVQVIIGNNASTDGTERIAAEFQQKHANTVVLNHVDDCGPENNILKCLSFVSGAFLWIIGDDDLPMTGSLKPLLEELKGSKPDLICLESEWVTDTSHERKAPFRPGFEFVSVTRLDVAQFAHISLTFISSVILNWARLKENVPNLLQESFEGSRLIHFGWTLEALRTGRSFAVSSKKCLLATRGNSGGYGVVTVFGNNLPKIVSATISDTSREGKVILRSLLWYYLPLWILAYRKTRLASYEPESLDNLEEIDTKTLCYKFLLRPIATTPLFVAELIAILPKCYLFWLKCRARAIVGYRRLFQLPSTKLSNCAA
jgi:glycosyltransferase involved in cell wall biosynthesis